MLIWKSVNSALIDTYETTCNHDWADSVDEHVRVVGYDCGGIVFLVADSERIKIVFKCFYGTALA